MSTNEAIIHWVLANGEVQYRLYAPVRTSDALAALKDKGINFEECSGPSFEKVVTEVGGYGNEEKRAKAVVLRVAPDGARQWDGDFEFYVLREDFDLMVLSMLAGGPVESDNEAKWRARA